MLLKESRGPLLLPLHPPFHSLLLLLHHFFFSSSTFSSTSNDIVCVIRHPMRERERDENEARDFSPRVPDPFIRCAGRYVAVSIDLDPRPQSGTIYSLFGHLNRPSHITTASTIPETSPRKTSTTAGVQLRAILLSIHKFSRCVGDEAFGKPKTMPRVHLSPVDE